MSPTIRLVFIAAMCMAYSCGQQRSTKADELSNDAVQYHEVIHLSAEAKDSKCSTDDCAYAAFRFPQIKGGEEHVRAAINTDIEALVREIINARLPEAMAQADLQSLAEAFIEGYELFQMEFPDSATPWFFELNGDKSALMEEYFVLQLQVRDFMGGAHPNTYTVLSNYRLSDGGVLDIRELYDEAELRTQAEAAFREKHGLPASASLNDKGFMFTNGEFALPENMALTPDGLLLIYNPYEVAAYAVGATTLLIKLPADNV